MVKLGIRDVVILGFYILFRFVFGKVGFLVFLFFGEDTLEAFDIEVVYGEFFVCITCFVSFDELMF